MKRKNTLVFKIIILIIPVLFGQYAYSANPGKAVGNLSKWFKGCSCSPTPAGAAHATSKALNNRYDCSACGGQQRVIMEDCYGREYVDTCPVCNGTGKQSGWQKTF